MNQSYKVNYTSGHTGQHLHCETGLTLRQAHRNARRAAEEHQHEATVWEVLPNGREAYVCSYDLLGCLN